LIKTDNGVKYWYLKMLIRPVQWQHLSDPVQAHERSNPTRGRCDAISGQVYAGVY